MNTVRGVVIAVLYLLGVLSVLTWAIIFVKLLRAQQDRRRNQWFLVNWGRAASLREAASSSEGASGSLANLSLAGIGELSSLAKCSPGELDAHDRREMLQLALRQQMHHEQSRLEGGLAVLASIGSTSPFIGLFGTVWGIMGALKGISASESAGIEVVAGPIGEALLATAMGIAAAVPAVLAHNYFLRQIRISAGEMELFCTRFVHRAIRSGYSLG
jgi:biopolymer transport protein ExbB